MGVQTLFWFPPGEKILNSSPIPGDWKQDRGTITGSPSGKQRELTYPMGR